MTVNFDNAATTYPKPPEVRRAVADAVVRYGNAGRGGHVIAERMAFDSRAALTPSSIDLKNVLSITLMPAHAKKLQDTILRSILTIPTKMNG